ncbi:MAG: hypothetical protein A3F84_06500 [Candidatus Handelsmanbacteria bacterium RIFCSPLOWO2_12_FULL_64_10]|uniref:BFN domain-containing protein n=1 Tax=Handelsmanbacteria sp. (strain RIFCSPLOWO2_12_FULL_64_10) TaxID=1817868 RepID=A0A1F6CUM1_HANXR|nr:MAG: hypothetical protein A3F84_06500 [Candidatus Handelsmanbacteria bacterium RIFCSPLOWO2_12_FULL_64_10]
MSPLCRTAGAAGLACLLIVGYGLQTPEAQDVGLEGRPDLVRVEVKSVRRFFDPRIQACVVFLKSLKTRRVLPIEVRLLEADAIQMKLNGETFPRPLTHDLLRSTLEAVGAKVRYVLIDTLKHTGGRDSGAHSARIALNLKGGASVEVDARTGDAIALSVRTGTPIYVATGAMERNSIADEGELEREFLRGEDRGPEPIEKQEKREKKEKRAGGGYY